MKENKLILSWGFDIIRYHSKKLSEYGLKEISETKNDKNSIISFHQRDEKLTYFNAESFSSILGKRLIDVPADFNLSYLEPKREYESFIFDLDDMGNEKLFTCEESKLGNYFGANPKAPQFTTPIFFKKEVLNKYYSDPKKYSVDDGYISCSSLWGIRIDNNLKENVTVFLGDLGRLPHKEQLHWKIYNITKGKISEPFFKRNFEAEFCSPSCPAEFFKEKLSLFESKWEKKFGWKLLKPLNSEDEHHLKTLRIPAKDNQKEFDDNLLSLTKILIDSLNQAEMKKGLTFEEKDQSIAILEKYLEQKHKLKSKQMIEYLKSIQELRSRGSAHRKSKEYSDFYSKFDKGDFSKTFEEILVGAIITLNTIENKILGGNNSETKN